MLDIKLLRSDIDKVKKGLESRNSNIDLSEFVELDTKRRELLAQVEVLKNKQNTVSKQVPILKKEGKDVTDILAEMKSLSDEVKDLDQQVRETDDKLQGLLLTLPNIPNEKVPVGSTDEDNLEVVKR